MPTQSLSQLEGDGPLLCSHSGIRNTSVTFCGGLRETGPHGLMDLQALSPADELSGKDSEVWACWWRCGHVGGDTVCTKRCVTVDVLWSFKSPQ